jgi:hypothetical protein
MNPRFILDENVVILAQQGLDEHGNPSAVCADLIQQIIKICHTIVVDDVLWDKFDGQLNHPGYHHSQLGPYLMRILWNALTIPEKVDGLGNTAPSFDEEGLIPPGSQDDTCLVRLAVETGAILVTTDGALRDDLNSSGIQSTYSLTVVSPEDALGML